MPRTSKKLFEEDIKEKVWESFFGALKQVKSAGDIEKILSRLLPQDEMAMFEKRLMIVAFLEKGVPIREISRRADVTRRTITFLRSGFKQRSNGKGKKLQKHYPDGIWKNQKIRKVWPSATRRMS